jgi:hypothetical protein
MGCDSGEYEEKANAEARRTPRDAEALGCRRMGGRSGVPAIGIAGAQGLAPIGDAPPEDVSEQSNSQANWEDGK